MHEARALDIAEDRFHRIPGQCVALAHITGADQTYAEWLHVRTLLQIRQNFWNIWTILTSVVADASFRLASSSSTV